MRANAATVRADAAQPSRCACVFGVLWLYRYRLLFADRITLFLVDPVKRELWITVSKV